MAVPADLEQLSDLVEGEPQPLRRLDHAQRRHRFLRVEPVPAGLRCGSASKPRRS
jgi:hypothetical protein